MTIMARVRDWASSAIGRLHGLVATTRRDGLRALARQDLIQVRLDRPPPGPPCSSPFGSPRPCSPLRRSSRSCVTHPALLAASSLPWTGRTSTVFLLLRPPTCLFLSLLRARLAPFRIFYTIFVMAEKRASSSSTPGPNPTLQRGPSIHLTGAISGPTCLMLSFPRQSMPPLSETKDGQSSPYPRPPRAADTPQRCDGAKPACQQCVRAKKADGCEYDDGKGKTRTQLMREHIARLELRVKELEGLEHSSPAVTLFDPHSQTQYYSGSSSSSSHGSPGNYSLPTSASPTPFQPGAPPFAFWADRSLTSRLDVESSWETQWENMAVRVQPHRSPTSHNIITGFRGACQRAL